MLECLVNEAKGIRKIVELVGGTWGQVPLEKKFELVEKALFRSAQKSDETGDSYLSRCDVIWTELIAKGMTLAEVRAYIVLRGGPEDKKRVIVESGAEAGNGELELKRVTQAIRMLASGFFQDLTGARREKSLKTYDHTAFTVEDQSEMETGENVFWASAGPDEVLDDQLLETLAAEDDEDAAMVMEFEDAIADSIQSNTDIAAFYTSYQEARRRLTDKVKFRGFWGVRKGMDKNGKKGKMKGRGKGGSLASRIANSYCRICMKKGHWKNECPSRGNGATSSASTTSASSIPTSFVMVDEIPAPLTTLAETSVNWQGLSNVFCFSMETVKPQDKWEIVRNCHWKTPKWSHFIKKWKPSRRPQSSNETQNHEIVESHRPGSIAVSDIPSSTSEQQGDNSRIVAAQCLFASHGSLGVIDLGASQTVIGDRQVPELINALPSEIRAQVKRVACNLCFRFGNHQTLTSRHALSVPLGSGSFRIAVVPGNTPFLLSSSFLKGIKAVIDTDKGVLYSKRLKRQLDIVSSNKNLFLMDINQLWDPAYKEVAQDPEDQDVTCFVSEPKLVPSIPEAENINDHNQEDIQNQGMSQPNTEVSVVQDQPAVTQPFCNNHPKIVSCDSKLASAPHVGVPTSCHVQCQAQRDRDQGSGGTTGSLARGGTGGDEDRVWDSQTRPGVSCGFRRSSLDNMVHLPLRGEPQVRAPGLHRVCQEACGPRDSSRSHLCSDTSTKGQDDRCQEQDQSISANVLGEVVDSGQIRAPCGVRCGKPVGSIYGRAHAGNRNCPTGGQDGSGLPESSGAEQSNDPHGERHAGDPQPCSSTECQIRDMSTDHSASDESVPDTDFVFLSHPDSHNSRKQIGRLIQQYQGELDSCLKSVQHQSHRRLDLLEVMCSSESELTKQMLHLGGSAMRFGRTEGDLKTPEGRKQLFLLMCRYQPRNIWYSPDCGPWCLWSNLNMNKSLALQEKILAQRKDHLWQISLGIVLLRFQKEHDRHFHSEQPNGSVLWQIPGAQELSQYTKRCQFDLCRVGNLRDPQTGEFIRKRLTVETTSGDLHRDLHNRKCDGSHSHKQIAGSTVVNGQSQSMSSFTALYPVRFARCFAKILKYDKQRPEWILTADDQSDHPTKRRRLTGKWGTTDIAEHFPDISWSKVMETANSVAPRVGTKVIDHGPLLDQVQLMCPQHCIKHLVLCKGIDRKVGPNKVMSKGEAPLRRMIGIHRTTGQIYIEEEWEPWERLTLKGLRRKGEPIRLGMVIFANVKTFSPSSSSARSEVPTATDPSATGVPIRVREAEPNAEQPLTKRLRVSTELDNQASTEDLGHKVDTRETVDLISQKHGPLFQALTKEEQSWMLKLHRNLGHPGTQKLVEFCRQLGCPEKILHAIPDIRCSTCAEVGRPKVSRPSAIHEHVDFGDVVSMDGIVWTNSQGQTFNVYHMIDQGTSYHTAIVTSSKSSENAILALTNGWLQWAGPPGTLVVDAATELNSDEFSQCLQRHNIRCRTIATDAHWQNSKIERHGGILQVMLNKMDLEQGIDSPQQLQEALSQATSTKNQWSRHQGYPPEMLVFGKSIRVPGSVINEGFSAANALAINPQSEGQRFREQLAVRERARKAFAEVDNDQTLRRALVHRSRPNRGIYQQGEWVMIWKKKGEADGNWHGPMQVIVQEGANVIWVSMGTKLYRVAPEHVRPLSAVEEWKHQAPSRSSDSAQESSIIPRHGGTQYRNLTDQPSSFNVDPLNAPPPEQAPEIPNINVTPNNTDEIESHDTQSQQPDGEPEAPSVQVGSSNNSDVPGSNHAPETFQGGHDTQPELGHLDPTEVPVPETGTDDELFVDTDQECFLLQEDQCWCLEVEVNNHDIAKWKHSSNPEEMSFLVSAAKRQRSEVKLSTLTPEQRKLFIDAKDKEIGSWLSTNTVERILRHQVPTENILRCRWILTWKPIDPENPNDPKEALKPKVVPKARLVVLGYEDPLVHEIPRDSPTMSKLSRMLILQQAASRRWTIESFDIKTAFLRGNEVSDRILGLEPPEELRQKMKLSPQEIVKLLKGAYGRVDAPYLWFMELKRGLEELGFVPAPFDPCTFVLPNAQTGQAEGFVGIHVDDGLCCGSPVFQKKLMRLREKFPFGSHKKKNFTFTGLKIEQDDKFEIKVSQEQYVKDIQPIVIDKDRKLTVDAPVNEGERQSLRALVGSLQYAAVNSRPDVCSRLGWLQSRINSAKVSTLIEANKTLHEAKMHSKVSIRIQPIEIDRVRFIAFSDASFASNKEPDSHQGMIIMACDDSIQSNRPSVVNPIVWHSKKIPKVAVSTLSAEAMALAGSVDVLSWIRLYWGWLMNTKLPWKVADETLFQLPPAFAAIPPTEGDQSSSTPPEDLQKLLPSLPEGQSSLITTDCKSLYDLISRTAPPSCQEFRTQLQAKLIKEHLRNGIMIRWVPSGAQMADALTKVMDGTTLRECMALGRYCLKDEKEILKARSDSRARVQWLRQNAQ